MATRNIEINYKNTENNYDILYPEAIDNNILVEDVIKDILSLPSTDKLNDVLLKLVLPGDRYVVKVTVKSPGGKPFPNVVISNLESFTGETVVTNEDGVCVGFVDNPTPTIILNENILGDYKNVSQQLTLTMNVLNEVNFQLERLENNQLTMRTNDLKKVLFSPDVDEFNCSIVGDGQTGGNYTNTQSGNRTTRTMGKGGNAGEVVNFSSIKNNGEIINVYKESDSLSAIVVDGIGQARNAYIEGGTGSRWDFYTNVSSHPNPTETQPGNGINNTTPFLYPPTDVGGSGGGGMNGNSETTGIVPSIGGTPGGGDGGDATMYTNRNGKNATAPGAGGGGAGYEGSPGSGQAGMVGFTWEYLE